jgi:hypothetical protein
MFVEKLGVYYGVTVYALYPTQSTPEDSLGRRSTSYASNLADWLAKGILSSQSLFRTLISVEPLLLPEVRSGTGRKGGMSSLPARILDDYMICIARAWFTAHPEMRKPRKMPDMEDSGELGRVFISKYLIPKLEEYSKTAGGKYGNELVSIIDCNEENRIYYLKYEGLNKEIGCKPDMVAIILLRKKLLRLLVFEVAETDTLVILCRRHVIPRLLLYMVATYLHYGIPSTSLYVSLSPSSSPPALLLVSRGRLAKKMHSVLEEISKIALLDTPPKPSKEPVCSHCVYASTCRYAL